MTKLKTYLFYKNKTITAFAKEIKVTRAYLSRIVLGKIFPSRLLAEEIERKTNGEVLALDIMSGKKND
jgi:transcriptional regulator with XRE-family HTH domain